MKPLNYYLLLILLITNVLGAQNDSVVVDRDFIFKNGIYATFDEVRTNSPKYPNLMFELREDRLTKSKIIYAEKAINSDSIFAIVQNGKLSIRFDNDYRKLILVGSLCTFFIETYKLSPPSFDQTTYIPGIDGGIFIGGKRSPDLDVYCLDLKTGYIDRLECDYMDEILKRDNFLYVDYSLASKKERKKTLYSYVLKYNSRNPTYFRQ